VREGGREKEREREREEKREREERGEKKERGLHGCVDFYFDKNNQFHN